VGGAISIDIRAAREEDLDLFFPYLNEHLRDNGMQGTPLFMPMARAASTFGPERQEAFRRALATPFGQPGWRKLWLALTEQGECAAHVDLRARPEALASHRALLGMGVHRDHRRQGLGRRLIDTAWDWALAQDGLDWIDLEVLSTNVPARRLYEAAGFDLVGEFADMFRIDGEAVGYTLMQRRLHAG
jgi:RimJ/RimL family protein N-acetyltransferase